MRLSKSRMRYPKIAPVREAVTLLEVVISIGVATIGLLAAVALLPVAARQIELGLIADQAAAAGEAAQQSVDVIGVRNPLQWRTLVYRADVSGYVPYVYGRNTRDYPNTNLAFSINNDLGFRQMAYDAGVLVGRPATVAPYTPIARPPYSAPMSAVAIDPFLLSDDDLLLPANIAAICDAPADEVNVQFAGSNYDLQLFPYFTKHPFDDGNTATTPLFNMRRLSLGSIAGAFAPTTSWMRAGQAEQLFTIPDDLKFERPEGDRTFPAVQEMLTLDDANSGFRFGMKRETNRDLSWMVTLVPHLATNIGSTYSAITDSSGYPSPINNQIGTNATYTMSIVVHRRRTPARLNIIPGTPAQYVGATMGQNRNGISGQPSDEMVAKIAGPYADQSLGLRGFLSGGVGGGEVIIETPFNNPTPLNHIRPNDWVLLSGITTLDQTTNFGVVGNPGTPFGNQTGLSRNVGGTPAPPVVHHQWYRVVNVSDIATMGTVRHARAVTLEGPDWPVGNAEAPGADNLAVQVTIVPSVVAVFEKTVTLDLPIQ